MGSTHLCPYHRVVRDGHFRTNSPADSGQHPNLRIVRDPATRLKGRLRETTGQNHSMDRKKGGESTTKATSWGGGGRQRETKQQKGKQILTINSGVSEVIQAVCNYMSCLE